MQYGTYINLLAKKYEVLSRNGRNRFLSNLKHEYNPEKFDFPYFRQIMWTNLGGEKVFGRGHTVYGVDQACQFPVI